MYQIVKYIDQYKFSENDYDNDEIKNIKYESIKLLRSKMTNTEQLLLYYNSLTELGETWNREGLIKKYRLVKNIIHTQVKGYPPTKWAIEELNIPENKLNNFFEKIYV